MTGEKRIYNADLLEAIHSLDKKLGEHLVYCKGRWKKIDEIDKDVNGNDKKGIKYQNQLMWDEREENEELKKILKKEKRGMTNEIKVAIIISVINGLMTAGNIFNII